MRISARVDDFKVYFLDHRFVDNLINIYNKNIFDLRSDAFESKVRNTLHASKRDWKVERDHILSDLVSAYQGGQFSLFLGAGVSASAGMPDWETLINSLFVDFLNDAGDASSGRKSRDFESLVVRLNALNDPSTLMSARYIRKGLIKDSGNVDRFRDLVTRILYEKRDKTKSLQSNLLSALCALCMPQRTGARVRSVITYNFDDLLERCLVKKEVNHRSIYHEAGVFDANELPVFHVHGFLPENRSIYNNIDRTTLVFSEEGYHQIYTEAYHWSNLVQLNHLRDNHCLMVGLSLADPNLRRLLDISSKNADKPRHFAFMKRLSIESFCFQDGIMVVPNDEKAQKFLENHHSLSEQVFAELGVRILWFEQFDDIPDLLKKLKY
jgi:hypothetical protein